MFCLRRPSELSETVKGKRRSGKNVTNDKSNRILVGSWLGLIKEFRMEHRTHLA